MIKKLLFILVVLLKSSIDLVAQDSSQADQFNFPQDSIVSIDSLASDSMHKSSFFTTKTITLIDSLKDENILNELYKPYLLIKNTYVQKRIIRKGIPTVKEVKTRYTNTSNWKFWVIIVILAYVSFVRITNPNNFKVFMISVFNLGVSRKIWEDQRSFFGVVILQLFAIYLFIAALVLVNYMELKQLLYFDTYFLQYMAILGVLIAMYFSKFTIHALLGVLLKMPNLGIGFISNTISVNNFIAIIIFPFMVFSMYANNLVLAQVLVQTVFVLFLLSIVYRVARSVVLSNSFFSFPTFYLFLYLCALEIAPWFIIGKFLNNYLA